MANTRYEVYINDNLALARSMIIKHSAIAAAINSDLQAKYALSGGESQYYVAVADPTTWKYYLNLSGQYHASDTMMTVISQDTYQTIDFTVENLAINTATKAAYAPGTQDYLNLVAAYPTQELLIRGILNPTDMTKAIAADDGTILWFDNTLIESNEMSLMLDLQQWIMVFFKRWFNPSYCYADDMYLVCFLAAMFSGIATQLLAIRLKYCHTYQTHSYHIIQFLASHGNLDAYASYLTKPQMLWLYRNIRYIQRNAGQTSTFQSLIDHILTPRNIPLADWTFKLDATDLMTDLKTTPMFYRNSLNVGTADTGVDSRNVQDMLTQELVVAPSNSNTQERIDQVTDTLTWAKGNTNPTKILESDMMDLTDSAPYRFSDCLLNHWLYYASLGVYRAFVTITDPSTGNNYTLDMLDAFVVYMYCVSGAVGVFTSPDIPLPVIPATKVLKRPVPTLAEIKPLIDSSKVSMEDLQAVYHKLPSIPVEFLSITAFYAKVKEIHAYETFQHALFSTQGEMWRRGMLEFATLYCWTDYQVSFADEGTTFRQWFDQKGLNVASLTPIEMDTVASAILNAATGTNLVTSISQRQMQLAMIGIMRQLSSYSVQYIADMNTSPVVVVERASMRVGDIDVKASADIVVDVPQAALVDVHGSGKASFEVPSEQIVICQEVKARSKATATINVHVKPVARVKVGIKTRMVAPLVQLRNVTDGLSYDVAQVSTYDTDQYLPGSQNALSSAFTSLDLGFYKVTDDDRATMHQRYLDWFANNDPLTSLRVAVQNRALPGLIGPADNSLRTAVTHRALPGLIGPASVDESLTVAVTTRALPGLIGPHIDSESLPDVVLNTSLDGLTPPVAG